MADTRPRVVGLRELLRLRKPLRERPAPLVYFSAKEFARLIKGAVELERRPRGVPLAAFDFWPGGGAVLSRCASPKGQICFGQWTPAGPTHGSGVYLGCVCKGIAPERGLTPPEPCRLVINPTGRFQCAGDCQIVSRICRLGRWTDPTTGRLVLDCRCA